MNKNSFCNETEWHHNICASKGYESSIVNEVMEKISIFLRQILNKKKLKINNFPTLVKFLCAKNCCFCSFNFILLAGFCLWRVFVLQKFLAKKRNCLDNLIYNTTDVYHPQPAYGKLFFTKVFYLQTPIFICVNLLWSSVNFFFLWEPYWTLLICENLFSFIIICENLFLFMIICENFLIHLFCFLK